MPTILITGGAGFIGSHLIDRHLALGDQVVCVDNLITGQVSNLDQAKQSKHFQFIEADVLAFNFSSLPKLDYIYHLASPASPNHHSAISYHSLPMETMLINTEGTRKMLKLAKQHQARFLFTSSSEVYGDPEIHPQPETYNGNTSCNGPRSVYDEAKRFGETLTAHYHRTYQLDTRIIRIFNTFGPRMRLDDKRMIINFIQQALNHEDITLYGQGTQTRSLCFVDDLITGLINAMDEEHMSGEVLNIGSEYEHTVKEYAQMVKDLTSSQSQIVDAENLPEDDPKQRKPDLTKARELIGWQQAVTVEEGLKKTIEYFRSNTGN